MALGYFTVTPSAARLTRSLRDIGYDFVSAVADLVDNSIAAGASEVRIDTDFDGADSTVMIADDGSGMTWTGVSEALRFGSRREYEDGDLGRYGLGLKTASLSQCRVLTVVSRRTGSSRVAVRQIDLDLIEDWDEWVVVDPGRTHAVSQARRRVAEGMNTVVVWEYLDRVLPDDMENGWARRRLESAATKTIEHLSMVFHRFLDPASPTPNVDIIVNGQKLAPWDPFATAEPATVALAPQTFELLVGADTGVVQLTRHILPSKDGFSSQAAFETYSGPMKWNRQQGLYIYRADRLVQWGGWAGMRGIDEHTKFARAALDFETTLDPLFNINVAKMRVSLPSQLRQMLERPIHELCLRADAAYRKAAKHSPPEAPADKEPAAPARSAAPREAATTGLALRSAALQSGDFDALKRIAVILRDQAPDIAESLGIDTL